MKTKSNEEIDLMSIEDLKSYAKSLSQEVRFESLIKDTKVAKYSTIKEHIDAIVIVIESYKNKTK